MSISVAELKQAGISVQPGRTRARMVHFRREGKVIATAKNPAQLTQLVGTHKDCTTQVLYVDSAAIGQSKLIS